MILTDALAKWMRAKMIETKNRKRTILHVTECLGSGVLNYVKNMASWQIKFYDVVIAYSTRPETPTDFLTLFDQRVRFIRVNGFTREIEPINDLKAFIHIRKIVNDVKPDLIHLHSTKAGVLGRWAIDCSKHLVLYSPHAYSFLMMDCKKYKRKIYKCIEKLSDRKKCITIADSKGEYEAAKDVAKSVYIIPNGIDPVEIDELIKEKKEHCGGKNKFTVCLLGKAVSQKILNCLILSQREC